MLNLTRLFLLTTVLFTPFATSATNNAEILEQQALSYLNIHYNKVRQDARTEVKINPVSRGLKLKTCLEEIEFQEPKGTGSRVTLKAKCPNPLWQIFITARVKRFADAVISKKALPKRYILSKKDLVVVETEITNLRSGFYTSTADIMGWSTKRSIKSGTVLSPNMLTAPLAIRKGYSVVIEALRNGLSIKATGTALEDGEVGEQIRVRNDRSGKIIKAQVIRAGLVRVP